MYILYIDEAGCTGELPTSTSPIQPVFCLTGIIIDQHELGRFTIDFLKLKREYFPGLCPASAEFLDWMNVEIKGSELRRRIRECGRDSRRHALRFMDKFLRILDLYLAKIVGRVFIKPIGRPFNGRRIYTSSIQEFAADFQYFLRQNHTVGIMILDSRDKPKNANVSHSIFTQKYRAAGDAYDRILDMPLFGHSDNHSVLQAADLISSAFIFPMAAFTYCQGYVNNDHVNLRYHEIRDMFGRRLKDMQFRYQRPGSDWWNGGISTFDELNKQSSSVLFYPKAN